MNRKPDRSEDIVDEYLAGKSDLSRTYAGLEQGPVPDKLAASVKAMAREDLAKHRRSPGWFVPLAMTATILLSVGIYLFNRPVSQVVPGPSLVEQQQPAAPGEQGVIRQVEQKPAPVLDDPVQQDPIPADILDLLQNTSKQIDSGIETYPAESELESWTARQWAEQVERLQREDKPELAERYIKGFNKYFPDQDIHALVRALHK